MGKGRLFAYTVAFRRPMKSNIKVNMFRILSVYTDRFTPCKTTLKGRGKEFLTCTVALIMKVSMEDFFSICITSAYFARSKFLTR